MDKIREILQNPGFQKTAAFLSMRFEGCLMLLF